MAGYNGTTTMYKDVTSTRFVQPDVVASHFHLRPGDAVADFGAGAGYFLSALSHAVGSSGRVYACEIQKNLITTLGTVAAEQRLGNVSPLLADIETSGGIPLSDSTLDVGVLINTLFQLEDKTSALKEIARVTRKGGRLIVIDWTESFGGLGPRGDAIVSLGAAKELVIANGFSFDRDFPAGAHHYGLAFKKT